MKHEDYLLLVNYSACLHQLYENSAALKIVRRDELMLEDRRRNVELRKERAELEVKLVAKGPDFAIEMRAKINDMVTSVLDQLRPNTLKDQCKDRSFGMRMIPWLYENIYSDIDLALYGHGHTSDYYAGSEQNDYTELIQVLTDSIQRLIGKSYDNYVQLHSDVIPILSKIQECGIRHFERELAEGVIA